MATYPHVSTIAECRPLLPQPADSSQQQSKRRCFPKLKYRFPIVSEKGAVFMIFWNIFFVMALYSSASGILTWQENYVIEYAVIMSLIPFIGIVADCWIGRYRILRIAMYILLLGVVFRTLDTVIIPVKITALPYITIAFQTLAAVCHAACTFHFTTDHLIGASGEQLSFAIYWIVWGYIAGLLIGIASQYFFLKGINKSLQGTVLFAMSSISLVSAICMMECGSHWLITRPQLSNPIKHIAKVLNYARKHKYPERRSAITNWEEDCPSRIDLGKDKYGGPFTVEEVEDVKTVFSLVPIIVCIAAFTIPLVSKWRPTTGDEHDGLRLKQDDLYTCVTIAGLISLFGLPIYHVIIYPLFHNCIPSMLKRLGLGYLLLLLSFLSNLFIEIAQNMNSSTNSTCTFVNKSIQDTASTSWEIGPNFLFALSVVVFLYALFEFLIAQSPHRVKVMILCMMFGCFGCLALTGLAVNKLLRSFMVQSFPGCVFYYGIYSLITAALLILFVMISKWYKPRKRGDIVPYHLRAEKHSKANYK